MDANCARAARVRFVPPKSNFWMLDDLATSGAICDHYSRSAGRADFKKSVKVGAMNPMCSNEMGSGTWKVDR